MATSGHLTKIVSEKIGCSHPSCKDLECCSTTKIKMTTSLLNKTTLSYNGGEGAKKKILTRTEDIVILNKSRPHNKMGKPKKHFKKFANPNLVRIQTKNVKIEKSEKKSKFVNDTMNNMNGIFKKKFDDFPPIKILNPREEEPRAALQKMENTNEKYHGMIPTPLEGSIDYLNTGVQQQDQQIHNFAIVNRQTFFRMCHNFNISTRFSEFQPISSSKVESSAQSENQQFILDTLKNLSAIFDGRFDVNDIPACKNPDFGLSMPCDNFEVSCLIKEVKSEFLHNLKMNSHLSVSPVEIEDALSDEIWKKTVNFNINQAFS